MGSVWMDGAFDWIVDFVSSVRVRRIHLFYVPNVGALTRKTINCAINLLAPQNTGCRDKSLCSSPLMYCKLHAGRC